MVLSVQSKVGAKRREGDNQERTHSVDKVFTRYKLNNCSGAGEDDTLVRMETDDVY